jgi:hypothetical protein
MHAVRIDATRSKGFGPTQCEGTNRRHALTWHPVQNVESLVTRAPGVRPELPPVSACGQALPGVDIT